VAAQKQYKRETVEAIFNQFFVGSTTDEEIRMFCPRCEDPGSSQSPSASINIDDNLFNCMKSNHGGTIVSLIAEMKKQDGFDIRAARLAGRNRAANPRKAATGPRAALPTVTQVKSWAENLRSAGEPLRLLMNKRGFSVETVEKWQIGWDGYRYTIPVYDADRSLVNVRRYKMDCGPTDQKMLNIKGHGDGRLFALSILASHDDIVLVEGETDCILLNQYGIPAATHTSGASVFKIEWIQQFKSKAVYICYDNDEGGRKGAIMVASKLASVAAAVYTIAIPVKKKGGDVTDYLWVEKHTADDFRGLMERARALSSKTDVPVRGKTVSLEESMSQGNLGNDLDMIVTIIGKQSPPFLAPKVLEVNCDMSKGPVCEACPVKYAGGSLTKNFKPNDTDLYRFVDAPETRRKSLWREITGARCSDRAEFTESDLYTIEELIAAPAIDSRTPDEDQTPMTRRVLSVGTHATTINSDRRLLGRNVIDPKTGRQSMMVWGNSPVKTSLDNFNPSPEALQRLTTFRPAYAGLNPEDEHSDYESPLDKCFSISHSMSEHVTRVYKRDLLHVAYDLVWHSPLSFRVEGELVNKGWLEMMVLGDTRTGKSDVAEKLSRHYSAGLIKSCEGATLAGLIGGVQQIEKTWTTTWGIIPLNDRRLVVLDEVSGLKDKEVIENMSSIRSSGRAQITKISVEETSARTRLIWITNPGDGSMIADHPFGAMDAVRTVIHANEDIARFDFLMAAAQSDVPAETFQVERKPVGKNPYTADVCHDLVLWAWSLKPESINFSDKAAKRARELAVEMGSRYVPDLPLVQTANARFKLYRLAVAIAARTFSSHDNGKTLHVTAEHVEDAVRFLDEIYSQEAMGYARYSHNKILAERVATQRRQATKQWLLQSEDTVLHALRSIGGSTFRVRDFLEFAGMSQDDAQIAIKWLIKSKMVVRKSRGDIAMTRPLMDILRELEQEEDE
jgi:5S rRNA maturation endonuclease (ribonuclease M5)